MKGRGRNGKGREGDKKEVKGWKGRRKDLPDQCQTASYAPEFYDFHYGTHKFSLIGYSTFYL